MRWIAGLAAAGTLTVAAARVPGQRADAYAPTIAAAHAHLRLNEPGAAIRWLNATDETVRGWEWRRLMSVADASERSAVAHEGGTFALDVSADGSMLATGGADGVVRIWNAADLSAATTLDGHEGEVRDVAFNPDGSLLASASADKTVRLWDINAGEPLAVLTSHSQAVSGVAFSPDGAHVVSTGYVRNDEEPRVEGHVVLWRIGEDEPATEWRIGVKPVRVVEFAPDGKSFFVGDWDGDLNRIWIEPGRVQFVAGIMTEEKHAAIDAIAVADEGATVFLGAKDNFLHRVDTRNGQRATSSDTHTDNVLALDISPDGRWITSGSVDQTIALRRVSDGEVFHTLRGHTAGVHRLRFSPDGLRLFSVGADGDLKSWRVSGLDRLTDALTPETESHYAVSFNAAREVILIGGSCGLVHVLDASTGQERARRRAHDSSVNALDTTTDMSLVVTCSNDGTVAVMHGATGEQLASNADGHESQLRDVVISPDGSSVVSVSGDAIILRDLATLGEQARAEGLRANRAAFSPDGTTLAVASGDGGVYLLDAATLSRRSELRGHGGVVHSVAFNADGSLLVSGGSDKTARIWDGSTGRSQRVLRGHVLTVMGAAFSPDGSRIATSSYDQTVRIWDAATGESLLTLKPNTNDGIYDVAWSADGLQIGCAVLGAPSWRWKAE
jgi:WD40 repeat protein